MWGLGAWRRVGPPILAIVGLGAMACAGGSSGGGAATGSAAGVPPTASAPAPTPAASVAPSGEAPEVGAPAPPDASPTPCGALSCRLYPTAEAAFDAILAESKPRMLAIGETHKQKDAPDIASTTRRFTEQLLPLLRGRTDDLVVELWVADPKCRKEQVAEVAREQSAVSERQSAGNQNEFLALGNASKALGITPHILRPTCDEYDKLLAAGDDAVMMMLSMIARLTADKADALLRRATETNKVVVAYGGAMHNDVSPRAGREDWSYGPRMKEKLGGAYVELDLIVPEFIKDSDSWRALPWYPHFDASAHPDRATLFQPEPGSYVLVFPRTPR
jgi:hypothetical protein